MKLTDLQMRILGKMHLTPLTGAEIMRKIGYSGTDRAFANALLRMRDKGLIDCPTMTPAITFKPTPAGLGAFIDQTALSPPQREGDE